MSEVMHIEIIAEASPGELAAAIRKLAVQWQAAGEDIAFEMREQALHDAHGNRIGQVKVRKHLPERRSLMELSSSDVLGALTGSQEDLTPWSHWWPRVSRPCYNKFHRCPGWAGGGIRYARVRRCDGGYIQYYTHGEPVRRLWKWRCYRCPQCRVIVLPYMVRWLDWGWWRWKLSSWRSDLVYWAREYFSWWDEEGHWQAWAAPREAATRLPGALRETALRRWRRFRIMHGK